MLQVPQAFLPVLVLVLMAQAILGEKSPQRCDETKIEQIGLERSPLQRRVMPGHLHVTAWRI